MTKKIVSEQLIKLWKELNSDISKEDKLKVLTTISGIVHRELPFENGMYNISIDPCNMAINEFKHGIELDPNYVDSISPSNLFWFLQAVENSSLPL